MLEQDKIGGQRMLLSALLIAVFTESLSHTKESKDTLTAKQP
jgi:hypothetical protein